MSNININDTIEPLKLIDIINFIKENNNKKKSEEELRKFGNKIFVKSVLSIEEKITIATSLSMKFFYSNTEINEIRVAELYKNIFFEAVLQGYAQIDCSDTSLFTFDNYNLLMPILQDAIISQCEKDYYIFMEYLKGCLITNVFVTFIENIKNIDNDALKSSEKSNVELIKELNKNKDVIKDLLSIVNQNNIK